LRRVEKCTYNIQARLLLVLLVAKQHPSDLHHDVLKRHDRIGTSRVVVNRKLVPEKRDIKKCICNRTIDRNE
jgi:hypothetical protein